MRLCYVPWLIRHSEDFQIIILHAKTENTDSLSLSQTPEHDEVLQSIDRAIEGIHNVAMKNGGKYNLEQRDVLQ